jgi:hypothetical protein
MKHFLRRAAIVLVAVLVALQFVPYGRNHDNPPERVEPAWNSPETRALAVRACFDCHSNETKWPWYSHVAPASWLVQKDVDGGRRHLNFSRFDVPQKDAHEAAEEVQKGKMPLPVYLPLHPGARLSPVEKQTLIAGLTATLGEERPGEGGHEEGGEGEAGQDGD